MEEQVDREEDTLILMAAPVRQAGRVGIDLLVVEPEPPLFFTAFPAAYNSLTFHGGGGGIGMCGGWPAGCPASGLSHARTRLLCAAAGPAPPTPSPMKVKRTLTWTPPAPRPTVIGVPGGPVDVFYYYN